MFTFPCLYILFICVFNFWMFIFNFLHLSIYVLCNNCFSLKRFTEHNAILLCNINRQKFNTITQKLKTLIQYTQTCAVVIIKFKIICSSILFLIFLNNVHTFSILLYTFVEDALGTNFNKIISQTQKNGYKK